MINLGKTIQMLREERGMSQKELAQRVGVSTGAIGNYEIGLRRPKFETIEALADVFNVPLGILLGDEQTARLLINYERLETLINIALKLDEADRARLEERAIMMLEQEKYHED
jgi:transcriptional regulator with XRE-family HTH domain